MAEIMAVEAIIEAFWLLQDFWTKPRFAFSVNGGWSDVDVLAYSPEERHLVIAESKVQGGKHLVMAFTGEGRKKGDFFGQEQNGYLKFVRNVPTVCQKVFKEGFHGLVRTVTVQLVSNYYVSDAVRQDTEERIRSKIGTELRKVRAIKAIKVQVRLEKKREQGRRYGNFVIDIAREMNRYMYADIRLAAAKPHSITRHLTV